MKISVPWICQIWLYLKVSQKRRNASPTQKYFETVHQKKRLKLIKALKDILNRRCKGGFEKVKRELLLLLRGWCNYFHGAIPVSWMTSTDEWIRRRIRQILEAMEAPSEQAKAVPDKMEQHLRWESLHIDPIDTGEYLEAFR